MHTDFNADPVTLPGWTLVQHRRDGLTSGDLSHSWLLQLGGGSAEAPVAALVQATDGEFALNATAMQYLLGNQDILPVIWRPRRLYFTGTILSFKGDRRVLFLYWAASAKRWRWGYNRMEQPWRRHAMGAVLAV